MSGQVSLTSLMEEALLFQNIISALGTLTKVSTPREGFSWSSKRAATLLKFRREKVNTKTMDAILLERSITLAILLARKPPVSIR